MPRFISIFLVLLLGAGLVACRKFPEVDVSEKQFDSKTAYPEFVPLDELLDAPEPTITEEVESDLTTRRDDLQTTPQALDAEAQNAPVLDRLDALRQKRDETDPRAIFDEETRKRLESGITDPASVTPTE